MVCQSVGAGGIVFAARFSLLKAICLHDGPQYVGMRPVGLTRMLRLHLAQRTVLGRGGMSARSMRLPVVYEMVDGKDNVTRSQPSRAGLIKRYGGTGPLIYRQPLHAAQTHNPYPARRAWLGMAGVWGDRPGALAGPFLGER
jgi:hypothetical protein